MMRAAQFARPALRVGKVRTRRELVVRKRRRTAQPLHPGESCTKGDEHLI